MLAELPCAALSTTHSLVLSIPTGTNMTEEQDRWFCTKLKGQSKNLLVSYATALRPKRTVSLHSNPLFLPDLPSRLASCIQPGPKSMVCPGFPDCRGMEHATSAIEAKSP